jgi:ABC-type phosphate transport system permease subunit
MNGADVIIDRIVAVIINPLIYLLFAVAFLYFLWGVMMFIWKSDSDDDRKTGVRHMLWGIIGMFIMIAAFGIINLIENTLGL